MTDPESTSAAPPGSPRTSLVLFLATLFTVALAGSAMTVPPGGRHDFVGLLLNIPRGLGFSVSLMTILLCHEFGHYIAAKLHRVPASLPYFIPMPPLVSPFGTMGAVISMPERIRSRNALLDIGAAGPLAGLVVALPVLAMGLAQSPIIQPSGGWLEGQSLLYIGLKRLVVGPIPPGHDVLLSPMALAGWAGLLVTMLNLLPIAQLDGGHIAYALLGEKQNRVAKVLHFLLPLVFLYNFVSFGSSEPGIVWLVWFALLGVLTRATGGNHPPTEPGQLSPGRRAVAVLCLIVFVALFMPTPMREGDPGLIKPWIGPLVDSLLA